MADEEGERRGKVTKRMKWEMMKDNGLEGHNSILAVLHSTEGQVDIRQIICPSVWLCACVCVCVCV